MGVTPKTSTWGHNDGGRRDPAVTIRHRSRVGLGSRRMAGSGTEDTKGGDRALFRSYLQDCQM